MQSELITDLKRNNQNIKIDIHDRRKLPHKKRRIRPKLCQAIFCMQVYKLILLSIKFSAERCFFCI